MTTVAAAPAAAMLAPDKNRRRPASTNRSHRLLIAVLPCLRGAPLRFFPKQLYPYCRIRGAIARLLTVKVIPVAEDRRALRPLETHGVVWLLLASQGAQKSLDSPARALKSFWTERRRSAGRIVQVKLLMPVAGL